MREAPTAAATPAVQLRLLGSPRAPRRTAAHRACGRADDAGDRIDGKAANGKGVPWCSPQRDRLSEFARADQPDGDAFQREFRAAGLDEDVFVIRVLRDQLEAAGPAHQALDRD